jgi:hypothetical protein
MKPELRGIQNTEIQSIPRQHQAYLLNYISMEYDDYLQIDSGPVYLTEDKNLTKDHLVQLKIVSLTGVYSNIEFLKDQF